MSKSTKPTAVSTKGVAVTRQGAADTFGVALTTIDNWVRKGCPVVQRGSRGVEWKFNTADLHTWLCDQQVALATGKFKDSEDAEKQLYTRKLLAQTELAELELAKAKADVVALPQVERAISNAFASVQAGMRALPARVARLVIGETDEARFKEVLLKEIDQALSSLASLDLAGLPDEDDALTDPDDLGDGEDD